MNTLSRRRFLTLAGIFAVAASGIALAVRQLSEQANTLTFQAVTGLPGKPLLSYASYVISGNVNVSNGAGTITKYIYAGPPEHMTNIPLYTRTVRVTGVIQQGSAWHITGVVTNQAQLQKEEDATLELQLDSSRSAARSTFFGSPIQMQLHRFALS
ncbi:MAG TPA: hypothetical protein VKV40_12025 [Ktedonobacteraceae bacterium]|nr:hypothetical protein [Ktedonobacteraceae bacterium]